jgi:hypothetical protein
MTQFMTRREMREAERSGKPVPAQQEVVEAQPAESVEVAQQIYQSPVEELPADNPATIPETQVAPVEQPILSRRGWRLDAKAPCSRANGPHSSNQHKVASYR